MTSINDGKDVKSNQASGQKGKTYYIELYKSLDTQLNAECSLHARVTLLCNAWRRVHTLCQHSVPTTHPFLLAWIQRHTARTVLQTEWQSPTSKDEHTRLGEALESFLQECRDASSNRDGGSLPWETQLQARAEWFKGMLDNPWDHPVLKVLLDPNGEGPSTDDILKWLLEERGVVFCARLRQLALSKCDDLALTLLTAVMDRVRSSRPPVNDCAFDEESQQSQPDEPTFLSTLNKQAGFAESWDLLTDMEFVLLHKSQRNTRLIDLAKQTPLGNGYQLVERLINRLETNPKEKKIWKNAKDVATLIAQVMITRCMVIPVCLGSVRTVLYWCSRALVKVVPPNKLGKSTLVLAAPAATARHLHTLATAVHAQQEAESGGLKPFVVELYVRAITFGMNELEKLKLKPEYEEKEARATEQTLATWFIQFGQLLSGSERMRCECTLTAFSVHPSPKLFERIKKAPTLKPVTVEISPKKDEPGTTDNSWANDSHSMTNFVKTSETLNLKQTQNSANVLSTAIVSEGEALGLDAELCTDIIVLLSGPRVKTLSWDMEREALLENCRAYMERTQGGTRALTTELKYLNIDPAHYQHLPEEEDNEDDLYYGIEKGYEHLVEIEPQPEEIWEDVVEAENTETTVSSSSEGETKRKKKSKPLISSSESDTDPLSLVAEHKKDKAEKKERPHSKERSSSKEPSSKKSDDTKKDGKPRSKKEQKKEKKERKKKEKKEKEKPANSLSHLVGVKVTQVTQEEARALATDSDYDSQGKSSLQSEGTDENIVYDGQYSIDEQSHKRSPEFHTNLSKELDAASGHINKALCPSTGKFSSNTTQTKTVLHTETPSEHKKISSELKKSINRLINFRKQKASKPPSETSSQSSSSLSSLIGTKLQNTSNLVLTKAKSDQLAKNEVKGFGKAIYYPPKSKNKPSEKCSRTQPFLPSQSKQKPPSAQPSVDMSSLPQDPAVLDNAMNQYTQMQGQKPQSQPAKPSSQTSHLIIYQQFLQQLQKNSAAGLPITKEKTEVKPMTRPSILKSKTDPAITTNSPLAHPESAPQCAKPTPPKKVESTPSNVPNTFARLSYMKSKLNEKTKPETNPALQYSVSEELDRRIAELRSSKMKLLEKESLNSGKIQPNREQPKVEVQSIEQPYVNTPSLPKEHPVLSNILRNNFGSVIKCSNAESQKVQNETQTFANKPKQSSLTEKDQQDISKLLGQKSSMGSYHGQPLSAQVSAIVNSQVFNNTQPQTSQTNLSNKSYPELSKQVQVIQPPSSAKVQQKPAQNNNETIEIRARLPINVAGTDFQFPVISNTTILRTTAMIQDSKVCPTQLMQPKQTKAKAKRKNARIVIQRNPANALEVNKAVSKKYVPKPPIPTPKFDADKKEQDWTQVMDALRSQKTPNRGPDALDMTLNKAAYKTSDPKSVPTKTELDLKIENIIASIMQEQAAEKSKNNPNILRQPSTPSTGAVPKTIKKPSKYPMFQNKPAQMESKILNVPNPTYPIEEPKRHLQPELIKEDPFISGNPNADYDILDGLLDDDLRQEIGELLLEEDNYSASNISAAETKQDLCKNKHLIKSNVQAQPQITINQGFIKAAQPNKQIPVAATSPAPQKEKLRIISNEKVDIRDLADNILPVIRKAPATVVNKPQDVTIQSLKSTKQTVTNTTAASVLKPTNVVYSESPKLISPNMVIYDPFGVSKSNQNFVSLANTSNLVYQPYQILQSTLIIPTVDIQQAPVNVTFNAVPTTVAVQIPQVVVNQPIPVESLPVSEQNQNIIKPANEQPILDCAASITNTINNITVDTETKSCKSQCEEPKIDVKAKENKKEQTEGKQKAPRKPKVTPNENVAPSISSDQVAVEESSIRADKPTEKVSPAESLNERDSVEPNKVTDDIRIHEKRQAIINREIHHRLYYPPIPLGYASLAMENHGFDENKQKILDISDQSVPTEIKESVENKDENEDKAVCRRILLRSSNTIKHTRVAKQDDKLRRKTKVRLKDRDRNETQINEIPVKETKSVLDCKPIKSSDTVKDDSNSTVVSKTKEHDDVKTEARHAVSTGSTRVSKRIQSRKIKDTEKEDAKTQRDKCTEGDLKQNKNVKKTQDNNRNATAVPDAEDTDIEATLPGAKILKTKEHAENIMKSDDKLGAPKENTVNECPKIEQAAKKKSHKPLVDISIANKSILESKEIVNSNTETIEILSSPEIIPDEDPLLNVTKLCNKNEDTTHTQLKNAVSNTHDETLALKPLDVTEKEYIPALGEVKSVEDELNLNSKIESAHSQGAIVKGPVVKDATVSDDALTKQCEMDSSQMDSEKIESKQVEVSEKPYSGTVLTRDEVISVITPIGQKLSTNSKLTKLIDDIESALSAITDTAVSSPVIETPIDKEINVIPANEQGINGDTPEKPNKDLESIENSKDKETIDTTEIVQCDTSLDPKNPDENLIAELPQAPATTEGKKDNTKNARNVDATLASDSLITKDVTRTSPKVTSVEHAKTIHDESTILTSDKSLETKSPAEVLPESVRQETYWKCSIKPSEKSQGNQTTKKVNDLDKDVQKNLEKNVGETIALSDDSEVDSSTEADKDAVDESADVNRFTPKDIPQSYKDSIHIVEIPIPGNTNPFKRCVRIKLPNNRMFKATVHGKISVSFDSLFEEPTLKNILLSDLHDKKKYTLSVSVPPNENRTQPKTIETVNLISDDEDEPEVPLLQLKTTSGAYKIRHVNNDMFKKHQEIFTKKCSIKLQRCDEKPKSEIKESLVEALLKELVPSLVDKPSEVIEIPDSDSENESQEPLKIYALKDMLLKDLGVADNSQPEKNLENNLPANAILVNNSQPEKNLENNLPANAILVENKRLSRSRKSIYHRDREPVTLIIPEKRSSSQNKRSKSVNSNKSQNSNGGDHRPDYSHIIKRKCYIELERCDNMVKKLKNQITVTEQSCLSDKADDNASDDETSRILSRSGSFSLLNDLEAIDVPVVKEIASFSQAHHDVTPNRTSPVMKVYDLIVALNKISTKCTTVDLDASKCTSDWFYTKRDMHSENVGVEYVSDIEGDAFEKTDIPTDCDTDATEFETFEDNENASVSSLQSIMAKYFENNPIVNIMKPLRDDKDDVSKTPVKRKSAAQHDHICKVTKISAPSNENSEIQMIADGNFNAIIDSTQIKVNGSETDGKFDENLIPNESVQNITPLLEEEVMHISRVSQDATVLSDGTDFFDDDPIIINTAETLDNIPFSPSLVGNMPEITYCKERESDKTSSSLERVEVVTTSSSKETATIQEEEIEILEDASDDLISNEMTYECNNRVLPYESDNSNTQEQENAQSLSSIAMEISESSNQSVEMDISDISANIFEINKDCLTSRAPIAIESLKLKVLKLINEQYPMNATLVPDKTECSTEYETMNKLLKSTDLTTCTTEFEISLPDVAKELKTLHKENKNTLDKVLEEAIPSENKVSVELGEHRSSATGQETPDLPELAEFSPSTIESVEEVIETPPGKAYESEESHEIIDLEKSPNILDPTNDQPLSVVELPELLIAVPIDSACKTSSNALVKESQDSSLSEIVCSDACVPDIPEKDVVLSFEPEHQTDTELNETDQSTITSETLTYSVQALDPYPEQSESVTVISEAVQCGASDADNSNSDDMTEPVLGTVAEPMDITAEKSSEDKVQDQESIVRAVDSNNSPEDTDLKREIVNKEIELIDQTVCSDNESNTFLDDSTKNEEATPTEIKPSIETVAENYTLHAEKEEKEVSILHSVNKAESVDMERDKLLREGIKNVAPELQMTLLNVDEKIMTIDTTKTEMDNGPGDIEVERCLKNIVKHEEPPENVLQISSSENNRTAIENQQDEKTFSDGLADETEVASEALDIISEQYVTDNYENRETLGNELESNNQTPVESRPEENIKFIKCEQDHTIIMNQPVQNTGLNDNIIDDTDMIHGSEDIESQNEKSAENAFKIASPQKTTPIESQPVEITHTDSSMKETEAVNSADANEDISQMTPAIALIENPPEEKITQMAPVETPSQDCSESTSAVEQFSPVKYEIENFTLANIDTKSDSVNNISDDNESIHIENNNLGHETAIDERTIENQSPADIKQPLDENQRDYESPTGVAILERLSAKDNVKHKDLSIEVDNNFYKKLEIEDDVNVTPSLEENIEKKSLETSETIDATLTTVETLPSEKQLTFEDKEKSDEKLQDNVLSSSVSNEARSSCTDDIKESSHSNENKDWICCETVTGNDVSDKPSEVDIPLECSTKNNVPDLFHTVSKLILTDMNDNNNTQSVTSEINVKDVDQNLSPSPSSNEIDTENLECETEVITEKTLNNNSKVPSEVNIQEVEYNQSHSPQRSPQEIETENLASKTEVNTKETLSDNSEVPSEGNIQEEVQNLSPLIQSVSQEIETENLESKTEVITEETLSYKSEVPSEVNIHEEVHNLSPSVQNVSGEIDAKNLECEAEMIAENSLNDDSEVPSEVNIQEVMHNQSPSLQSVPQEIDAENLECETEVITEETLSDNSEVLNEGNIQEEVHNQSPLNESVPQEIYAENLECETEVITEETLSDSSEVPCEVSLEEVVHNQSPSLQSVPQEIDAENLECETELITEGTLSDNFEVPSEVNIQEEVHNKSPLNECVPQETAENLECETEVITEETLSDNFEVPSEVNIQEEGHNKSPLNESVPQETAENLECETEVITEETLHDNSEVASEVNIQEVHNKSPLNKSVPQEIDNENLECETEVITEANENSEVPSEGNIQEEVHNQSSSFQSLPQEIENENLESKTEMITEETLSDNSEVPSEVNIQEEVHNLSPSIQSVSQEIDAENLECGTKVITEGISNENFEVSSERVQEVMQNQTPPLQSSSEEIYPENPECETEVNTEETLSDNFEVPSEQHIQAEVQNLSPLIQSVSQEIKTENLESKTEVIIEETLSDNSEVPCEGNIQEEVHNLSPSIQSGSQEIDTENLKSKTDVITEEISNRNSEVSNETVQEVMQNQTPPLQSSSEEICPENLECETEVITEETLSDNAEFSSEVNIQEVVHNKSSSSQLSPQEIDTENLECETEVITVSNENSEVPSEGSIQEKVQNLSPLSQGTSQEILECETEVVTEEILSESSAVQEVIELPSPTSSSSGESSNIIAVKAFGEIEFDENILEKNATLVYKDDSGVVLKGIEYNDPEIGPCYVFPLAKSSDDSEESELLNENVNSTIEVIQDLSSEVEMQSPKTPELKTDLYDDEYLQFHQPKVTYAKRKLKRKSDMKDFIINEKRTRRNPKTAENIRLIISNRFRKGKKIDITKMTAAAIAKTSYVKEFKELMEHFDNIEFSYSISLGREFIDVPRLLQNWPIKGPVVEESNDDIEAQNLLFVDTQKFEDPLEMSFVDEITADYNDANYPITADETDKNVGFGEGSGRVIQNLDGGAISKFSAATLSDVKQSQPFLLSEKSDDTDMVKFHQSSQQELLETIKRLSTYLDLKEKVRSFFKNTTIELTRTSKKEKDSINNEDTSSFPFHLYIPKIVEPRPLQTIVQVVQVGQLPVSAAAQNPVTCDPRVTQVSDASPSQCSVDSSPLDLQHDNRTEYTELTTADLSMPLVEEYTQHNQSLPTDSQEGTNMTMSTENIPIQTEMVKSGMKFVEIADENAEEKEKCTANSDQIDGNSRVVGDFIYGSNNTRAAVEAEIQALFEPDKEETSETISDPKPQNGSVEKTDQIAHAMNAAGISTTPETVPQLNRAQAFVNLLSQKIRQNTVVSTSNSPNSYPKTTTINAMSLSQALAQILPPPLNQTNSSDNNPQNTGTPQVLHIVQGKGGTGNQITLLDNTQQSVITAPNATPVLHIVQNKSVAPGSTSNGSPAPQSNAFGGISLVDAGLQQGGNQLLHIVNTGNQKNNNASQLLKRVNLLTNLTNVQGSNEQKMVQFVCKSADGKSIQLNAPHQRSMVLRLQPIDPPNIQAATTKPAENQELSPTSNSAVNTSPTTNKTDTSANQQEIKSRSIYEENYAKFIQSSSSKSTVEKLPKFNQAFGKSVYQDGNQKQNEINTNNLPSINTGTESTECPPAENTINLDHIGPINSPPLLLRKSPQTSQTPHPNLVQQIKQAIAPMNLQTMHGGVIYTRQIPVNIGGGQTINLITVPSTEIVDESGQKQQINQEGVEPSIIKIVPQSQPQTTISEGTAVNDENAQQNPPQPVLTQMRIKLPMLSKNPQMVSGARVVRPSFFQIQRNIVGGANQQVYQQLVLTAAPPLGQQTIRLPQAQTRQIKIPDNQSPSESQMSTSTLEQLREFDMVLEQVKERSTGQPNSNSNSSFKLQNPSTDTTDSPPSATSTSTAETTQVLYSIGTNQPINVAYVNRKTTVTTPTTSTFVRSPDSSGIADSPTSASSSSQAPLPQAETSAESSSTGSTSQPKVKISSRQRPRPKPHLQNTVKVTPPPKPSAQKPLEDEQTTQRILYILAEYKEQVENSPDKDKPAPRRRNNPPTNPSGSSKRKKSSSGSRRSGRDLSPIHGDDMCRTMGSEDSSCGTSQGDCNESCMDSHSPQDSPQKVSRKLTFEPEPGLSPTPKAQPQTNVIVADGQTITVARGTPGKPATAVLMPANYILPVSMVKGGQQIAIVTNRGPKLLTVGGGDGGATNALLLQRLIGPAGLKPMLARPGVRQVRLPTAALHNLQAFNLATASNTQPPDSTASPASDQNPPDLVESNRTEMSPWADRSGNKPDRASSPEETEPWNLPSSADPNDYSYEETVRAENMDRTVLDQIQDRYSPDMEAQRIFDKMFDVEKKSYSDSPRCGYDIDASDCDDKPYQVVHKKDSTARQGRFAHVSAAALRHKYAILEHELRLQKSLSEECEDLGVDSPSASELFPEAELLFAGSPAQDPPAAEPPHHHLPHTHRYIRHYPDVDSPSASELFPEAELLFAGSPAQDPPAAEPLPHHLPHTPQPTHINQSAIQPDIDDQIATDHLLQQRDDNANDRQDLDVNLGLEDVGIVTVSQDGMQATIALDQEEFARSHPNTTFHSEPTDASEVQPFAISGLKSRPVTSTIFHSNRASTTVLMTAPQPTVISQTTTEQPQHNVKYSELDNMIHTLPSTHTNNMNLPSVLVKDDGLTRFDNILTDSRELHLSNTASAIVHSSGNATQVIRRVCYDENKRTNSFLMDEPDPIIAGDDAKMVAEDSSRDATLESMAGDVDDDNSSPGRNAELFWESNSASERSESRRPLDFSSDSEKCCKSPSYDETNSTDSSGIGAHMRLDSVIKDARGIDRSGSADGSSADDTHPPLRTYPPKRLFHTTESDAERSLSGKTRAGERSPDTEVRRRASGRGVVKRGCHCCNGSPAPTKPKKPRQRKSTSDFTH